MNPDLGYSVLRVLGALAIVFALLLGSVWVFRNWQRLTVTRGYPRKLNVVEVRSLGPRHALYVVGYEQQRFLLSSAPTGMALLTTLPSETSTEKEPRPAALPTFAEMLARAIQPAMSRGK